MPNPIRIVEQGDPIALIFLIGLSYYIGQAMILKKGHLRVLGVRIAAAAFLLYLIYGWITYGDSEPSVLVSIVWRAGLLYGLTQGFSWIGLSAAAFCIEIVCRQVSRIQQRIKNIYYRLAEPRRLRQQQLVEQRHREEYEQRHREEYEQQAPERLRLRREQEKLEKQKQKLNALRSQQRYEARLLYNRLLKAKTATFSREEFEKLLEHALTPNKTQLIGRRMQALTQALGTPREVSEESKRPRTRQEIAEFYERERQNILQSTSLDEAAKERHILRLNREEGYALEQLLRQRLVNND